MLIQTTFKPELRQKKRFIGIFHNRVTAWIILTVSLLLTATAYFVSKSIVDNRRSEQFSFRANEIEHAIQDRMRTYEQVLIGGVGLFHSSKQINVSRNKFAKYVATLNINKHWPGIQGMGFSVPVKAKDLRAHEKSIQAEGFPGFQVRPVGKRDEYSSIIYLEPFDWRNKRAHGYDMWSNDMRRAAMTRARDEGVAATSGIITLVQETAKDVQKGFLTYLPVYKTGNIPNNMEERRKNFVGWVYAAFRTGDLMKGIIGSKDKKINFQIFDGVEQKPESLLFSTNLEGQEDVYWFSKTSQIILQGRPWAIQFSTPVDAYTGKGENLPQFIAIFGVIIDLLIFYVLFALHFVNKHTEEIVVQRTKELQERAKELEIKTSEMEEFTYRTSHDLKAPLVNIHSLSNLMRDDLKNGDYDEVSYNIQRVSGLSIKLKRLVGDLVEAAKVGNEEEEYEEVDIVKEAELIKENIYKSTDESQIVLQVSLNENATIWTKRNIIRRVLENLMSNAIRYSDPEKFQRFVRVDVSNSNGNTQIQISDNGLGIPEEFHSQTFGMFKRFHKTSTFGSGLGLYLVKKNLEKINGEISFESTSEGTVFTIVLPALKAVSEKTLCQS
jgi:CHASE1-domain containing sensor protein/nitrogen-specific signal transduction histidine kinase